MGMYVKLVLCIQVYKICILLLHYVMILTVLNNNFEIEKFDLNVVVVAFYNTSILKSCLSLFIHAESLNINSLLLDQASERCSMKLCQ